MKKINKKLNSPQDTPEDQIQKLTLEEIAYAPNEVQDCARPDKQETCNTCRSRL